jgi:hypothetical protein
MANQVRSSAGQLGVVSVSFGSSKRNHRRRGRFPRPLVEVEMPRRLGWKPRVTQLGATEGGAVTRSKEQSS